MKIASFLLVLSFAGFLAGCNQPDPNAPGSNAATQNPPTEDPSPKSGTGGDSQANPAGTSVDGAAGNKTTGQ